MKKISWEELYRLEAPKLLAVCRRYVNDLHKAEDLMHDAFLTAIHKQAGFSNTGAVEAWLRRIAVNTVLQYLRQEKKLSLLLQTDVPERGEEQVEDADDPQNIILAAGFDKAVLLNALDLLPEHHKTVFNLYVFEEYSHKQIAEMLGIIPATSKSHLARARKKIQAILLQKAKEMKEKQRRAAIILFPFLKEKEKYLDDMYKQALSEKGIQPTANMSKVLAEAMKTAPPIQVPTPSVWLQPMALGGTSITVIVVAVSLFLSKKQDIPAANMESKVELSTSIDQTSRDITPVATAFQNPVFADTQQAKPAAIPIKRQKTDATATSKAPQPVIIRKQIILKDTVLQIIK